MTVLKGLGIALLTLVLIASGLVAVLFIDDNADAVPPGKNAGLKGVPAEFKPWIRKAAGACEHPELTPPLMASQLFQELHFNTDRSIVSPAGAEGPAQFMPGTWATWGRDDDNNGVADPYDIGDAVMAQGRYMCSLLGEAKRSNISGDVRRLALAGYNAGWYRVKQFGGVPPKSFANGQTYNYVRNIMTKMPDFQGPDGGLKIDGSGTGATALRKAKGRLGTPYSWGGGTPTGPSTGYCDETNGYLHGECSASHTVGFDCSSLVRYAYWSAIQLPRTAAEQYNATSDHPVARDNLQQGDLVFWKHPGGDIYHVALYAGDGKVLQAPRTGRDVEIANMSEAMPVADYHGATRPS